MEDLRSGIEHLKQAKAHMSEANGIMSGHISKLKALEEENAELKAELADWKGNAEGFEPDAYMKLPLNADGEPIRVGDVLYSSGNECRVVSITVKADEACVAVYADDGTFYPWVNPKYLSRKNQEPLEPEVLDADGVPIKVGDVVYFVADKDDGALTVERIDANGGEPAVDLVYAGQILRWHSANPEKLTHERPDSWRLWGEDLDMAAKVGEVDKVEMMRRAKALAKAGEGL